MIHPILTAIFLGINSGVAYAFLAGNISAHFSDLRIPVELIGLLSVRTAPYYLKFIWSPMLDSAKLTYFPANFGQRKSWMVLSTIFIIICLILLAFQNAKENISLFFAISLITCFFSATADICLDSYRAELFEKSKIDQGCMMVVFGFRAGLLLSGALGLYLMHIFGWEISCIIFSLMLIPGLLVISFSRDNFILEENKFKLKKIYLWFKNEYKPALLSFFRSEKAILVIIIVSFFKLSDGFLDAMIYEFLAQMNYTKAQLAGYLKTVGLVATILGTLFGNYLNRFNILKALLIAELLASLSNIAFMVLTKYQSDNLLAVVSFAESFCYGVANISLYSYMTHVSLNTYKYKSTQFALLVSISGLAKLVISSLSGFFAVKLGWVGFFVFSSLLSLPSLLCLTYLIIKNLVTK